MIVIYNRDNRLMIPRSNGIDQVMLIPGSQEISTVEWFECRHYVLDKIEDGVIEEEWAKKGPDDKEIDRRFVLPDPEDTKNVRYPAILKDRNKNEARKIVEKCDSLATLKKWNNEELRPEVSLAILLQLKKNDSPNAGQYKENEKRILENYGAKR